MFNVLEWFLVLFQPMRDERLRATLAEIGMPEGNGPLWALYTVVMIALISIARFGLRSMREGHRTGETWRIWGAVLGGGAAVVMAWGQLIENAMLFTRPGEVLLLHGVPVPSFYAAHRALLPFDVSGIQVFLTEGEFGYKLRTSLLFWEEDSRGLYLYPAAFILVAMPGLRRLTGPVTVGAVAVLTLVPLAAGAALFSIPIGMATLALLLVGCGGLSWSWAVFTGPGKPNRR